MSATFACPHCGATYPYKPVLVGRTVRCTTCKNAFRLREDGIADKVEMAAPAPAAAPVAPAQAVTPPPAVAPKPAPAPTPKPSAAPKPAGSKLQTSGWGLDLDVEEPKASAKPAPAPAPASEPPTDASNSAPQKTSDVDTRKSSRMTAQQLEARRAMAATLSTSMSAALKSEAVKREERNEKAKAKSEGRVGKIGPAVLTGEGVQQAKSQRLMLLGTLGFLVLAAGVYWLLFTDSKQRAALTAYTAEVDPRIRAGERLQAIQARAWLVGVPPADIGTPPLIDMDDARIGSTRVIKLDGAKDAFVSLKGLVLVEPGPVWVPPERVAALDELRRPDQKPEAFIAAVLKREKKAISHPALLEGLTKNGMSTDDAAIVDLFIRGRTADAPSTPTPPPAAEPQSVAIDKTETKTADGEKKPEATKADVVKPAAVAPAAVPVRPVGNAISRRWMDGDVPTTLEVTRFFGSNGTLLLSRGQSFKTVEVEYNGRMARFTGPGWPEEWRVLTIETKSKQRF